MCLGAALSAFLIAGLDPRPGKQNALRPRYLWSMSFHLTTAHSTAILCKVNMLILLLALPLPPVTIPAPAAYRLFVCIQLILACCVKAWARGGGRAGGCMRSAP